MPRSAADMIQIMLERLPQRTGQTYEQWVEVARGAGIDKHKALTTWLKSEHGLNHNEAQWVAWGVTDPGRISQYDQPTDLVSELYSGKRAALRPIYDGLLALGLAADEAVEPSVCKTYTSLANRVQFAILVPRTLRAVDLELALPEDAPVTERLTTYKSSNPRFTRRVRISDPAQVDEEVAELLRQAAAHTR